MDVEQLIPAQRRLFVNGVAIAVNLVVALASVTCFAAVGIDNSLRRAIIASDDSSALGFAAFTAFYAVSVAVVCVARVSILSWVLTGFSMFFFAVVLILAGMALDQ